MNFRGVRTSSPTRKHFRNVGGSLEIGTLTTAIGFFCFIPTSYRGVAELGIISGAGMFISLFVTLVILPAFLVLRRPVRYSAARADEERMGGLLQSLLTFPLRHSRAVLVISVTIAVLAALQLKFSKFDINPLNLQDPSAESVHTFRELLRDSRNSPWSLAALSGNEEEARVLKAKLEALPVVDKVMVLNDFVPANQDEKLELIDQLALIFGPNLETADAKDPPNPDEEAAALRQFLALLSTYLAAHPEAVDAPAGFRLAAQLARLVERIQSFPESARDETLHRISQILVGSLPGQLHQFADKLKASRVGIENLPQEFKERWLSKEGIQRPKEDLHDPAKRWSVS